MRLPARFDSLRLIKKGGRRVAVTLFRARTHGLPNDDLPPQWRIFSDTGEFGPFHRLDFVEPVATGLGVRFAAKGERGWFYSDGVETIGPFEEIEMAGRTDRPFAVKHGGRWYPWNGGQLSESWDDLVVCVVGGDLRAWAFSMDGKWWVRRKGRLMGPYFGKPAFNSPEHVDGVAFGIPLEDGGPGPGGGHSHPPIYPDAARVENTPEQGVTYVDGSGKKVDFYREGEWLGTFRQFYMVEWAPDGSDLILQDFAGEGLFLHWKGERSGPYLTEQDLRPTNVARSDSRGRTSRREEPYTYDSMFEAIAWDASGRRPAAVLYGEESRPLWVDGKRVGTGHVGEVCWLPGAEEPSFVYFPGPERPGCFVMDRGKAHGPYDLVKNLRISPDGKTLAWNAAEKPAGNDVFWYHVLSGETTTALGPYDRVGAAEWSPDGRVLLTPFVVARMAFLRPDFPVHSFDRYLPVRYHWSSHGNRVAFELGDEQEEEGDRTAVEIFLGPSAAYLPLGREKRLLHFQTSALGQRGQGRVHGRSITGASWSPDGRDFLAVVHGHHESMVYSTRGVAGPFTHECPVLSAAWEGNGEDVAYDVTLSAGRLRHGLRSLADHMGFLKW